MQRQPERLPFSSVLFVRYSYRHRYRTECIAVFPRPSISEPSPFFLRCISVPSIVSLLLYPNCAVASADGGDGRIGEGADFVELAGGGGGGGVDEVGEVSFGTDGLQEIWVGLEVEAIDGDVRV